MSGGDSEGATVSVEVTSKEQVADGVVRLGLADPTGEPLPHWDPGAHIDVTLESGVVRQYSLCGAPERRDLFEIAVLREADSRGGSTFVHEEVTVGDSLQIRGPRNHFQLFDAPHYLFIAGGIGITPIIAMLQQLGESASWRLVYGGRSRSSMAFRDYLTGTYGDRVSLQPEDECGLLDLESELGDPAAETAVYCCGPEPLLQAVEKYCAAWPKGSLHIERFSPKSIASGPDEEFEVELAQSGRVLTVPTHRTLVDVLHEADVDVPVSCLEGVCGTCETAVLDGSPEHRDSILTEEEKEENDTMFVCVSRCRFGRLRLDL